MPDQARIVFPRSPTKEEIQILNELGGKLDYQALGIRFKDLLDRVNHSNEPIYEKTEHLDRLFALSKKIPVRKSEYIRYFREAVSPSIDSALQFMSNFYLQNIALHPSATLEQLSELVDLGYYYSKRGSAEFSQIFDHQIAQAIRYADQLKSVDFQTAIELYDWMIDISSYYFHNSIKSKRKASLSPDYFLKMIEKIYDLKTNAFTAVPDGYFYFSETVSNTQAAIGTPISIDSQAWDLTTSYFSASRGGQKIIKEEKRVHLSYLKQLAKQSRIRKL